MNYGKMECISCYVTEKELRMLEELKEEIPVNRSALIRIAIRNLFDQLVSEVESGVKKG